ncbi:serine/threonine-protein phosphatase 2A 56 kDa regulatory subunit alpha isoform-like [Styela clava]
MTMLICSAGQLTKSNGPRSDPLKNQLPKLACTKPSERLELFARKLHACCTCYNFADENSDLQAKELKLVYLQEIIEYIDLTQGVLTHEPIYALSTVMISRNIFRTFAPKDPDYDPDEDDAIFDPAWPHLELVYQYFLHFLEANDFQPSIAKKYMDTRFVTRLLYVFGSDDMRERDILKTILHRVYGKFLGLRATVRRQINNIFLAYLYDGQEFTGVAEILEILGSIINGYVSPMKPEHHLFLDKILIPLHSSKDMAFFQPQLVYCVVQYMEKDPKTAANILKGLFKFWPKTCSTKEVLFLGELEELIDAMQPGEFTKNQNLILKQLSKCITSHHFQVAERSLYFFDNEYIMSLVEVNADECFPLVLHCLKSISLEHWNMSISTLAATVLQTFKDSNPDVFYKVLGLPRPPPKPRSIAQSMWMKAAGLSRKA